MSAPASAQAFVGLLAPISDPAVADEHGWAFGISSAMTAALLLPTGALISLPPLVGPGGIIYYCRRRSIAPPCAKRRPLRQRLNRSAEYCYVVLRSPARK